MSGKFTEKDVLNKLGSLSEGFEVLDRTTPNEGEVIVNSVKSTVFSSLNADIDCVYFLALLFSNRQSALCGTALSLIKEIQSLAALSQAEPREGNTDTLLDIQEILEKLDGAGDSSKTTLLSQIEGKIQTLVSENKGERGGYSTGMSSSEATTSTIAKASLLFNTVSHLLNNINGFIEFLDLYMNAATAESSFSAQLSKANIALEDLIEVGTADTSNAALEVAVLHSLLSQANIKRDIRLPKFDGPVITLPGISASMIGDTVPLVLSAQEQAGITVDSATAGNIIAPKSESPNLVLVLSESKFFGADSGVLITPAVGTISNVSSDGSLGTGIAYLKSVVKPLSIQMTATIDIAGTETTHTLIDNGFGQIAGFPTVSLTGAIISPDIAPPTGNSLYSFTGANAINSGVGPIEATSASAIEVKDNNNTIIEALVDNGSGVLTGQVNQVSGTVNLITGEVQLDLTGMAALPAGSSFVLNRYIAAGCGTINYDTGLLKVFTSQNSVFAVGKELSISYEYYPMGKLRVLSSTPGGAQSVVSTYDEIGVYKHNTVLQESLGVFDPYFVGMDGTSAGLPIRNETDLAARLVTYQAGYNAVGLYVTASVGKMSLTIDDVGSLSRLAFFNLQEPTINPNSFAPTWEAGKEPAYATQALGGLYSVYGEVYGKDTVFELIAVDNSISDKVVLSHETGNALVFGSEGGSSANGTVLTISAEELEKIESSGAVIGDTLMFSSPFSGVGKIAAFPSATTVGLENGMPKTVPDVGQPVANLIEEASVKFSITSNNLLLSSAQTEATSKLEITQAGLGFTGSSKGNSVKVSLSNIDLSPIDEVDGYTIKPNDAVVINDQRVAEVVSVVYPVVSIRILEGKQEGVDYTFPFTSLRVEALGFRSWRELVATAHLYKKSLSDFLNDNEAFYNDISVYAASGSGHEHYAKVVYFLSTLIGAMKDMYSSYDAHVVKSVSALLDFLKEEKLLLVHAMLENLDFSGIASMSASQVSQQASIDNYLEDISHKLGANIDLIYEIQGDTSQMDDYMLRGGLEESSEDITEWDLDQKGE